MNKFNIYHINVMYKNMVHYHKNSFFFFKCSDWIQRYFTVFLNLIKKYKKLNNYLFFFFISYRYH